MKNIKVIYSPAKLELDLQNNNNIASDISTDKNLDNCSINSKGSRSSNFFERVSVNESLALFLFRNMMASNNSGNDEDSGENLVLALDPKQELENDIEI